LIALHAQHIDYKYTLWRQQAKLPKALWEIPRKRTNMDLALSQSLSLVPLHIGWVFRRVGKSPYKLLLD